MRTKGRADRWALAALGTGLAFSCATLRERTEPLGKERDAAIGQPRISADFPIVSPVEAFRSSVPILAASAGQGTYLLVYHLYRAPSDHSLFGVRVRFSDGALLDPSGFTIARVTRTQEFLQAGAVYAGDHWLVVFQGDQGALNAVTVSNAGAVGAPTSLGVTPLDSLAPALVWGGDRALLAVDTRGAFLSGTGAPIGSPATIFSPAPSPPTTVARGGLAFDGTSYLVEYFTNAPAAVRLFSLTNAGITGRSADAYATNRAGASTGGASLATDGSGFLLRYTASPPSCAGGGRCSPPSEYYRTATVASNGDIALGAEAELSANMAVVHTNGSYLLWDRGDVLRMDSTGSALGPTAPLLNGVSNEFFALLGNSTFGLLPSEPSTDLLAVSGPLAIRVNTSLAALDNPPLAPFELPTPQTAPAATFDGTNYLVAWADSGRGGVRGARVSPAGTVLDTSSFAIGGGTAQVTFAASNGSGSLVGWLDSETPHMSRVAASGSVTPVDLANLPTNTLGSAVVASNGLDYLAVWSTHAARIPATGTPAAPVEFSTHVDRASVAFDGMNYVVVQAVENGSMRDLLATRVGSALDVLDAPSKVLLSYAESIIDPAPVIASDGTRSLVVWFEGAGQTASTVRCARVTRDLDVLDPGGVTLGTGSYPTPGAVAAWDGTSYWVLWEDRPPVPSTRVRLLGRRLTAEAVPIDAAPFVVLDDLHDESLVPHHQLAVTRGPADRLLLASVHDDPSRDGQSVRGRFLSSAPGASGGEGGEAGGGGDSGASNGGTAGGPSTGGRGGTNGSAGDGAAGEAGGPATGGRGGTTGSGGSATGATSGTNATGGAGKAGGGNPPKDDSGCSCRVPAPKQSGSAPWLAAALALFGLSRRISATSRRVGSRT